MQRFFQVRVITTNLRKSSRATCRTFSSFDVKSTVDNSEITKFSVWSEQWWDIDGPLKTLHHINPKRIQFIRNNLMSNSLLKSSENQHLPINNSRKPLSGLRILDLGCGAGVLSEPLARLGAQVVGVDASRTNIQVATLHSKLDEELQKGNLQYIHTTAEDLVKKEEQFDVVCALEVIEHVSDIDHFVQSCSHLLKNNGKLFISTLNRTIQSYLLGIVGAEYVLGIVEKGTHDWNKFVQPRELEKILNQHQLAMEDIVGLSYNPVTQKCQFTNDTSVNYILSASKKKYRESPDASSSSHQTLSM